MHFCIEVEGLDALYERLRKAGVRFHCPPIEFSTVATATYGRNRDGNVFELLELTVDEPVLLDVLARPLWGGGRAE